MTRSDQRSPEIDEWIEKLAWLMDRSLRIGPWSIGLDPLLGLIPGIGDAAGGLISGVIVLAAAQAGLPRATVLRMIANVAIDSLLSAIPFVGDIFDFAFKANSKNVSIFKDALQGTRRTSRDRWFLVVIVLALLILLLIPLLGVAYLFVTLLGRAPQIVPR